VHTKLDFGIEVWLGCLPEFPYYSTRSAMRISLSRFPLMVTRLALFLCFQLGGSKYEQEKLETMIAQSHKIHRK